MVKWLYCAQHNDCKNTDCYRKPTPQELSEMIRKEPKILWYNYHITGPGGALCENYRGDDYHD